MRPKFREFTTGPDDDGRRLDRIARRFLPGASLPAIYRAIRTGGIRVEGRKTPASARISSSARLQIDEEILGAGRAGVPKSPSIPSQSAKIQDSIPLLLETRNLIFVSKPRGILTHGQNGLDDFMLSRYLSSSSLSFVPAPLHRLDRNTTGVVACSRTLDGARVFSAMLREGKIRKRYVALLEGELLGSGIWEDSLDRDEGSLRSRVVSGDEAEGRKRAKTYFESLVSSGGKTLAILTLGTGRTHQIRVQAAARGHPLAGDRKYRGGELSHGYILHAWTLGFDEPPFDDVPPTIIAALGEEALETIGRQFGDETVRRLANMQ